MTTDAPSQAVRLPRALIRARAPIWAATIAGVVALSVAGTFLVTRKMAGPPPLITFAKMGHLVSLRVNYADVVDITENRTIPWTDWHLPLTGTRVLLIARGDCSVATDLKSAIYQAVDTENRRVVVALPTPEAFQPRLNHSPEGGTTVYAITNEGIERLIPGDSNRRKAIDKAMSLAQQKVEQACATPDAISSAKSSAEEVLVSTFNGIGWNASIAWKK
jgi:hypothetical protein